MRGQQEVRPPIQLGRPPQSLFVDSVEGWRGNVRQSSVRIAVCNGDDDHRNGARPLSRLSVAASASGAADAYAYADADADADAGDA